MCQERFQSWGDSACSILSKHDERQERWNEGSGSGIFLRLVSICFDLQNSAKSSTLIQPMDSSARSVTPLHFAGYGRTEAGQERSNCWCRSKDFRQQGGAPWCTKDFILLYGQAMSFMQEGPAPCCEINAISGCENMWNRFYNLSLNANNANNANILPSWYQLMLLVSTDGQRSDCPEVIANVEVQVSEDSELGDPKSAGDDVHCFRIAFTLLSHSCHCCFTYVVVTTWVIFVLACFVHVFYFVLLQAVRFLSHMVPNSISIWHDYDHQTLPIQRGFPLQWLQVLVHGNIIISMQLLVVFPA